MNRWNLGLPFSNCNDPSCRKTADLQRCAACKAVVYCSREHQAADRARHKSSCAIVKRQLVVYKAEASTLQARICKDHNQPPCTNFTVSAISHMFTAIAGATPVPRSYLEARFGLITALLNMRTGEAVEAALAHASAMLQVDRGDVMNVRAMIPTLLLRLGRDQDAYDFIKWYATAPHSKYQWGDPAEPFLDLCNEDATEDPGDAALRKLSADKVQFLAALVLLKVRLVLDLAKLRDFVAKRTQGEKNRISKSNDLDKDDYDEFQARMEWVREEAMSGVLLNRQDLVRRCGNVEENDALQDKIRTQIQKLVTATWQRNPHYWPALHSPTQYSHESPTVYTRGSREECVLAFRETWYGWSETPRALEFIKPFTKPDLGLR